MAELPVAGGAGGAALLVTLRLGAGRVLLMTCVTTPLNCGRGVWALVTPARLLISVPLTSPVTVTPSVSVTASPPARLKPLTWSGLGPLNVPVVVWLVTSVTLARSSVSEMSTLLAGLPLLANVTVLLKDASGETIGMKQTDDNGYYEFAGLPAGEYGVEIPAFTDDIDGDFNEQLGAYFAANDPAGLAVSLGTDSTNNDLGFGVDTLAVLDDLDPADADANGYTMIGTGKTIGFWKHQNNVAIKGKGRAQINAETLKGHLDAVEAGWLIGSGTFEFTSGNDYEDAFAILSETSSDEVSLLRKQLLGTELNHVSGGGLVGEDYALQSVLIGWGEYLAVNDSAFTREEILEAKDIFDWINNTGE